MISASTTCCGGGSGATSFDCASFTVPLATSFCASVELNLLDTAMGSLKTAVSRTGRTARKMGTMVEVMCEIKVGHYVL